MATPVFAENRNGVLIFEFPVDKFKNVMSRRGTLSDWKPIWWVVINFSAQTHI